MRKDTVIAHFGGIPGTAKALNITEDGVRRWGELVPPDTAIRAYCASNGELFLDPWLYHDWPMRGRVTKPLEDRRLKRNTHGAAPLTEKQRRRKFATPVREDEHGLFIVTNGEKYRPGGIPGYDHAYEMGDMGLKVGDRVWARHKAQTQLALVTKQESVALVMTPDIKVPALHTVVWASEYLHERERYNRARVPA